jgi:hypothetical protein
VGWRRGRVRGLWQSTVEGENEVWPDFHPSDEDLSLGTPDFHPSDEDLSLGTPDFCRNPKGRGHFSSFLRRLSLTYPGMQRSAVLELGKMAPVAVVPVYVDI